MGSPCHFGRVLAPTRRTLENAACAPESLEHVLRKVKQLKRPAPSLLSCLPVDLGTWREDTRFGCAVHPARVVSMMRLQACQCHPHELLLLVLSISVSSRTTFLSLGLSLTKNRSALESCQTNKPFHLSRTHAGFWYPVSSLCCRFSANLPKTHALMRCRLATSFTFSPPNPGDDLSS